MFSVSIERYVQGAWKPYPDSDLFVTLKQIRPIVKLPLSKAEDGTFTANVTMPAGARGRFLLQVRHEKFGYSSLQSTIEVI